MGTRLKRSSGRIHPLLHGPRVTAMSHPYDRRRRRQPCELVVGVRRNARDTFHDGAQEDAPFLEIALLCRGVHEVHGSTKLGARQNDEAALLKSSARHGLCGSLTRSDSDRGATEQARARQPRNVRSPRCRLPWESRCVDQGNTEGVAHTGARCLHRSRGEDWPRG